MVEYFSSGRDTLANEIKERVNVAEFPVFWDLV